MYKFVQTVWHDNVDGTYTVYNAGTLDELTSWPKKHLQSALSIGLIALSNDAPSKEVDNGQNRST